MAAESEWSIYLSKLIDESHDRQITSKELIKLKTEIYKWCREKGIATLKRETEKRETEERRYGYR